MASKETNRIFTYQTRLQLSSIETAILDDCAQYLSHIERRLFAEISAGKDPLQQKFLYIRKYGITARHFNALRVQLEGKMAAIEAFQTKQLAKIALKIPELKKRIKKLEVKKYNPMVIHQKKRLCFNLEKKLERLQHDKATNKVGLCFGSKKLFKAQFNLQANGYQSHEEWSKEWKMARSNSFFLLGSKDEASGNQSCSAAIQEDGSFHLRIRLPDFFCSRRGKYLILTGIQFKHGHSNILTALQSCKERKQLLKLKNTSAKEFGIPISYRFKRDHKGWRVFVSLPIPKKQKTTSSNAGVIGVDINANHLSVTETDRFGNPIATKKIALNTYGKTRHQTAAVVGDACTQIIVLAKEKGKTIVLEKLDFSKKKLELKDRGNPKYARMLSSLTYSQIINNIQSQGWKTGVEIAEVNPAYTSIIGRTKFAKRYGLTVHSAAALVIGRRHLRTSERVPRHLENIPDGKGGHVTLSLPVRNRDKHVWSTWRIINQKFKTVHAAHFRARNRSLRSKSSLATYPIPEFDGEIPSREFVNSTA